MSETLDKAAVAKEPSVKKDRHRSPNYPCVGLEKALARAGVVFDKWKRAQVPAGTIHEKWCFKPNGAAGSQVMSALKAFGLVEIEGAGERQLVKISELAQKILGGHPDKESLIAQAALKPPIYNELWEKYKGDGLPPDETITLYLQWHRESGHFNPSSIPGFIEEFRNTIAFAKLSTGVVTGANIADIDGDGKSDPPVRSVASTEGAPANPAIAVPAKGSPSMSTETIDLDEGPVTVQAPRSLSQTSVADLKDWLDLLVRKMERRSKVSATPPAEEKQ